jgi:uncharacterized protein YutE (UPF0331/DUF86 family)
VSRPEDELLREALLAATGIAERLARSLDELRPLTPLTAERLERLDEAGEKTLDAFMKRYEQLVTTLQDQVFEAVVAVTGGPPSGGKLVSCRDYAEFMEKLEVIDSAARHRQMVEARNRLAHVYPSLPAAQVRHLNDALALAPTLLADTQKAVRFARARGLATDPIRKGGNP